MIGETLGSYRILRQIGAGGMGVVYYAEHALIGRKAAVKLLLPELSSNPELVDRFFNEARAATVINHPGLVDVFDFGYHSNGSAFIVMSFLEGESLASRLRREPRLPAPLVVAIARQIAQALGAAHAHQIVHRDLKPDNLFLCPDLAVPIGLRAKVLDFGIAKLATDGAQSLKTRTGSVMGTPTYMAPEQCRGAGTVDRRADIYALGCIIYEMLCGRPPFLGEGVGEILGKHMYEDAPRPTTLEPSIPPALEAVIVRALAKKADDRQQSMEELAAALDAAVPRADGSLNTPIGTPVPVPNPVGPHPTPITTLGGAAAQVAYDPTGAHKPRGRGMIAALAVGVLLIGGIGIYVATAGGGGDPEQPEPQPVAGSPGGGTPAPAETPPAEAPPATTPPADTPSADTPPPSDPGAPVAAADDPVPTPTEGEAVPPSMRNLAIESVPTGADVVRVADGARVGKTPFTVQVQLPAGEVVYLVKLAGYEDARVVLTAGADKRENVTLVKKKVRRRAPSGDPALDPWR